jgi:uncharacterized spore protein YtfJ
LFALAVYLDADYIVVGPLIGSLSSGIPLRQLHDFHGCHRPRASPKLCSRQRLSKETWMSSEPTPTEVPGTAAPPPRRRTDELLATLAERIGARLSASTVYGTPVERDGVTVVPVAAARFAIGGGGGSDPTKAQEGEGGGGAGGVTPVGYIELTDSGSRFVPLVHPARMLALVCCAVLAGLSIARPVVGRKRAGVLPWR